MVTDVPIISADSHITEPPDTYTARIDARFKDRAPRLVHDAKRGDLFVIDGIDKPIPMGLVAAAGKPAEELTMFGARFEDLHRGGWDPEARLADQARDGVSAEVIYPTVGMMICNHPDFDYKQACFDAYNLWIAEYCSAHPDRLLGIGQTAMRSVEDGIRDLRRIRELGLRGVMLPGNPGGGRLPRPDLRHHATFSYVFSHNVNNSGFRRRRDARYPFLALRAAARLPADDVHDHRLRRLGPRLRGDARRRRVGAARASGSRSSTPRSIGWIVLLAITFAVPARTRPKSCKPGYPAVDDHHPALTSAGREGGASSSRRRPAVLRNGLRHERIAHDVRVLPRRRRPGAQPVATARQKPHPDLVGAVRDRVRARDHDPGLLPEPPRQPRRVPRGHLDRR